MINWRGDMIALLGPHASRTMKRWLMPVLAAISILTVALAQAPVRVRTRPIVPPLEVLDRLGLSLTWHFRLPIDNPLDGIATLQVLPRGSGDQLRTELLVQTLA